MTHTTARRTRGRILAALILAAVTATISATTAFATPAAQSTHPVFWTWDPATPVGTSTLSRTDAGLSATVQSSGIPAGQAVTLWFIVFNNPSACANDPCNIVDLIFNPAAEGDFLVGGGKVIGDSAQINLGGALQVGDSSGSGFIEIGMPARAIGLTNPRGAEVHLALHSHGPAVPGPTLRDQINSFTGGCQVFLGNGGFAGSGNAEGPKDVPDAVGECSTLQVSVHR
jgi:hypothetical protein